MGEELVEAHAVLGQAAQQPRDEVAAGRREVGGQGVGQMRLLTLDVGKKLDVVGAVEGGATCICVCVCEVCVDIGVGARFVPWGVGEFGPLQNATTHPTPRHSPVTISCRMAPTDHRSAVASYLCDCRISGAMYRGEPHRVSAMPCRGGGGKSAASGRGRVGR